MPGKQGDFIFQRGFYLMELTGRKAANLKEFQKCIREIDAESIFYHMFQTLLRHYFVEVGYYNDFSHWLKNELREDALSEKIANVGMSDHDGIESVRQGILDKLKERMQDSSFAGFTLPPDRAFHFVKYSIILLPTKYSASNLDEFTACLKKINRNTFFYHFFSSRMTPGREGKEYTDDFSIWLRDAGHKDLAKNVASLDTTGYVLEEARKKVIRILKE